MMQKCRRLPAPILESNPNKLFMVSSASSGDEQTDIDRVTALTSRAPINEQTSLDSITAPISAAPTTPVPADKVSMPSMDTRFPHGGTDRPVDHECVASNEMDSSIRKNMSTSNYECLTPSGSQLTAVNLEIHERAMPAPASGASSVASWLASVIDSHPRGALEWSQLVATDPLAAEI